MTRTRQLEREWDAGLRALDHALDERDAERQIVRQHVEQVAHWEARAVVADAALKEIAEDVECEGVDAGTSAARVMRDIAVEALARGMPTA